MLPPPSKLKPLLLPLLLSQAWHARRRAPVLPEAEGERSGCVGEPGEPGAAALRVLVVGDSSAAGVGVAHQEQGLVGHLSRALAWRIGAAVQWQLVARKGANTAQALALVQEHLQADALQPADVAVVALGVNDIIDQVTPAKALRQRSRLAALLRQQAGARHIVFAPLPPVHRLPLLPNPLRWVAGADAREHDAAVARWAARRSDVHHVPIEPDVSPQNMAADGFHPAEPVYRHVGEELARFIAERLLDLRVAP